MQERRNDIDGQMFLCDILNRPVVESDGGLLGRVRDLTINVSESDPPVTGIILGLPRSPSRFLPWSQVEDISATPVRAKSGASTALGSLERPAGEIWLRKALLDRQIVDTAGAKVERVNDLLLRRHNGVLVLARVDVGLKGLLRRVGLQRMIDAILRWLFDYSMSDNLVAWRLVQPVGSTDLLRLKFSQARLSRLHPADLADILEDLDRPERTRVFRNLDIELAADVLEEADPKVQVELIQNLSTEKASDVLEQMSPSKATDLLQDLQEPQAQSLLEEMEPEAAEDVRTLLVHDEETAGGLMTTSFLTRDPECTVSQALEELRRKAGELDVVYYTYVTDPQGRLLGAVNLRELLAADPAAALGSLMETRIVSIPIDAQQDEIVELLAKYGLRAIPVVDAAGGIRGVIRFKALLATIAHELGR